MSAMLHTDPLTGAAVAVTRSGRDFPLCPQRPLIEIPHGCAFCAITHHHPSDQRDIIDESGTAVAVPNLFPLFSDDHGDIPGSADLILPRRHLTSFSELSDAEEHDLANLVIRRRHHMSRQYSRVAVFANVGAGSGGSQPHLHIQVVGADLPHAQPCPVRPPAEPCAVCDDVTAAVDQRHIITRIHECDAYVPTAPGRTLELRIAAVNAHRRHSDTAQQDADQVNLFHAACDLVRYVETAGHHQPYNLSWHLGSHPHGHLLLRHDAGVAYTNEFGVTPITVDLGKLAYTLQTQAARNDRSSEGS